ncbi:sulfur reduction protein DsrE [Marinobacter salinus]|uniref:Sulfur reduction protein DsrE n=1 Tax=Marinobacter salinus TaxID=1874317 RepID=A0A1D9GIZ3_9GAMM|nr:DsrE family protein [Marinobacter salinus]AOY87616.1 sulfur reduction protein DsrE [Marinobacter salinus]
MTMLLIVDQAPYGTWAGREALDMAFSMAAFDQPITLLFTGAGVNWLRQGQDASAIQQKSVEKNLSAAPVFGIEAILADRASCVRYGLNAGDLPQGVALATVNADLLANYAAAAFSG